MSYCAFWRFTKRAKKVVMSIKTNPMNPNLGWKGVLVPLLAILCFGSWGCQRQEPELTVTETSAPVITSVPATTPAPSPTPLIIQSAGTPPPPLLQIVPNQVIPTTAPRSRAVIADRTVSQSRRLAQPDSTDLAAEFPVVPGGRTRSRSSQTTRSAPGPQPAQGIQVWVNTKSGVYHYPNSRWYGNTKNGQYMSETEARSNGHRAAQNNQ